MRLVESANELHQTIEMDFQVESLTLASPRAIICVNRRSSAPCEGSHNGKLGGIRPLVQAILDKLNDAPVDIEPRDVIAQPLEASTT